jgi:hypothetical protein
VRELAPDCAFTEPGDDGRIRYKIRGRVLKGRKLSGDEAEWVVLDIVHRAIAVLRELNDDPTHLFGYWTRLNTYALLKGISARLNLFRDHVNELFSTPSEAFIPNQPGAPGGGSNAGLHADGVPWRLSTSQCRRTLAWHIAHQPFGIVAGSRQYQHAELTVFEGYAGTSASGFAAEVASEQAVAKLDYVEDLYRDWNDGKHSSGGATKRVDAEFERIRRDLGDLPGTVASPARLRTMLRHLTKTLHPGPSTTASTKNRQQPAAATPNASADRCPC